MKFKLRRRFGHVCLPMYRLNWKEASTLGDENFDRLAAPATANPARSLQIQPVSLGMPAVGMEPAPEDAASLPWASSGSFRLPLPPEKPLRVGLERSDLKHVYRRRWR